MTKEMDDVICEAVAWWRCKRPVPWNRATHLKHYAVNCLTEKETRLAGAVARFLRTATTKKRLALKK